MKIYSINSSFGTKQFINRTNAKQNPQPTTAQPTFKGFGGKVAGGLIGAGIAGLCTLATGGAAGPLFIASFIASEAGGAVIGGYAGDKLTGKDDD